MTGGSVSEPAGAVADVRVVLPAHLKTLARVPGEVGLRLGGGKLTQRAVLDALEAAYPVLLGTIRDRTTGRRRAFIRFYACQRDLSNEAPDAPLPDEVAARVSSGDEPFMVVGAMAGG
ncbi:MAG: MoaD/ThiS family protein [Nocardiopsaceae bacterium]|nr:MoaD/ThiS family protein [Nocardiopsaceae bacterium]